MSADPANNDGVCRASLASSRHMLVPWFLMASYAYYVLDRPLLTDGMFDQVARDLDAEWDEIHHEHKDLVDRGWLSAGTCLLAEADYPPRVVGAATHVLHQGARSPAPRREDPPAPAKELDGQMDLFG